MIMMLKHGNLQSMQHGGVLFMQLVSSKVTAGACRLLAAWPTC
jgi:hypothetical protein